MTKNRLNKVLSVLFLSFIVGSSVSCGEHIHTLTLIDEVSPSCENKGSKKHLHCSSCNKDFDANTKKEVTSSDLELFPLGHNFLRPGVYIKYPSCVEDGLVKRECSRCNKSEEVVIEKYTTHNFVMEVESDEYLYSLGDCEHKSVYYKSCGCGEKSLNEFFQGDYAHDLIHYEKTNPTSTKEGNIDYYSCLVCDKNFIQEDLTKKELKENPYYGKEISLYRKNGKKMKTLSSTVTNYLNLDDDKTTSNDEVAEFMKQNESKFGQSDGALPITLSWSGDNLVSPYTVKIYSDSELTNLVKEVNNIKNKSVDLVNLIPNKYYYQVNDSNNNVSNIDSFDFETPLRQLRTNLVVLNMRDLGGWITKDNRTVKYGLIYRSAGWHSTNSELDELMNSLNIKSEIDVRLSRGTGSDMSKSEHPIEGINYFNTGLIEDYNEMLTDETTLNNIKKLFDILANEDNYPLVYHCAAGADRTGLASYLLESALGFKDEDIFKDYELTSFFNEKRLRADVEKDENGNYYFNPNGICTLPSWTPQFGRLTSFFLTPYKENNDTLSDTVIRFLTNRVGVSLETINSIKNILLS